MSLGNSCLCLLPKRIRIGSRPNMSKCKLSNSALRSSILSKMLTIVVAPFNRLQKKLLEFYKLVSRCKEIFFAQIFFICRWVVIIQIQRVTVVESRMADIVTGIIKIRLFCIYIILQKFSAEKLNTKLCEQLEIFQEILISNMNRVK